MHTSIMSDVERDMKQMARKACKHKLDTQVSLIPQPYRAQPTVMI